MAAAQDLLSGLADIAGDYVRSEVRVTLETNVLPAVTIYSGSTGRDGSSGGFGLASAFGIRGGVVVRNRDGQVLAKFGNPARPDVVRMLLLAGALVGAGWLLFKTLR